MSIINPAYTIFLVRAIFLCLSANTCSHLGEQNRSSIGIDAPHMGQCLCGFVMFTPLDLSKNF